MGNEMVAPLGFVLYGGGGGRLAMSAEELCATCWFGFNGGRAAGGGATCGCAMLPAAYAVLVVTGALAPCSAWISSLSTSVLLAQRGDAGYAPTPSRLSVSELRLAIASPTAAAAAATALPELSDEPEKRPASSTTAAVESGGCRALAAACVCVVSGCGAGAAMGMGAGCRRGAVGGGTASGYGGGDGTGAALAGGGGGGRSVGFGGGSATDMRLGAGSVGTCATDACATAAAGGANAAGVADSGVPGALDANTGGSALVTRPALEASTGAGD